MSKPTMVVQDVIGKYAETCDRYEHAIRWALGQNGSFPPRPDGKGQYWWRRELRARAGMSAEPVRGAAQVARDARMILERAEKAESRVKELESQLKISKSREEVWIGW